MESIGARMTGAERNDFLYLLAADQLLQGGHAEGIERWIRQVSGGWRDIRMIQTRMSGLMERVARLVPPVQIKAICNQMQYSDIHIEPHRVAPRPGQWVIGLDDLGVLAGAAVEGMCMMCSKDRSGQKECSLRRVLDNLPLQGVREDAAYCPYGAMQPGGGADG